MVSSTSVLREHYSQPISFRRFPHSIKSPKCLVPFSEEGRSITTRSTQTQ